MSIYIDFLDGTIKLARGFIENQKLQSPIIQRSINLNESRLAGFDLNESVSKSRNIKSKVRGKYLEPCFDISIQYSRPKIKPTKKIIKNGSLCDPTIYNNRMYVYKSSCLFDTIFELNGTVYCNHIKYQTVINHSCKDQICFFWNNDQLYVKCK